MSPNEQDLTFEWSRRIGGDPKHGHNELQLLRQIARARGHATTHSMNEVAALRAIAASYGKSNVGYMNELDALRGIVDGMGATPSNRNLHDMNEIDCLWAIIRAGGGADTDILFDYSAGDSLASATRANTATYRDSSGVEQTAAIDVPRDGHYVGATRTLLVEPESRNVLLRSTALTHAAWSLAGFTSAAGVADVAGGTGAVTMTETATTEWRALYQVVTNCRAGLWTLSAFLKQGTRRYVVIGAEQSTLNCALAVVDTQTMTIVHTAEALEYAHVSSRVEAWGNGWYRAEVVINPGSTGTMVACVMGSNVATVSTIENEVDYLGDGSTIIVDRPQLEYHSGATSFITTVAAAVTRAADVLDIGTIDWLAAVTQTSRFYRLETGTWQDETLSYTHTEPCVWHGRAYTSISVIKGATALPAWGEGTLISTNARYEAFPGIFTDVWGRVHACYYNGGTHTSGGGLTQATLIDRSGVWQNDTVPLPNDVQDVIARDLSDGTKALLATVEAGGGNYSNYLWRSADQGYSWTYALISEGTTARFSIDLIDLGGGVWLRTSYDFRGISDSDTIVQRSTDSGATWGSAIIVAAGGGSVGYNEARFVRLANGDLRLLIRGEDVALYVSRSTDAGVTWSSPSDATPSGWGVGRPDAILTDAGIWLYYRSNTKRVLTTDDFATWGTPVVVSVTPRTYYYSDSVIIDGRVITAVAYDEADEAVAKVRLHTFLP